MVLLSVSFKTSLVIVCRTEQRGEQARDAEGSLVPTLTREKQINQLLFTRLEYVYFSYMHFFGAK